MITFALLLAFQNEISPQFSQDGWSTSDLYSAIFNWAAIQTGFVFGVYGFVVGKTDGFVAEAKTTRAMKRFQGYVKRANFGCFMLAVFSLPLVVTNMPIPAEFSWNYVAAALWFSLFVWSFLSFLRVSFGFGHLASVRDQQPFHGA